MKKLLLFVLVAFAATSLFAEKNSSKTKTESTSTSYSLSGNVIDENSGEALAGVEVSLKDTNLKAYTDFDGHFVLDGLTSGECKLVATYTSYNTKEKTVKLDTRNNSVKIELQSSK